MLLADVRSPLTFSRVLLCLAQLSRRSFTADAATQLIRDIPNILKQWTNGRRQLPVTLTPHAQNDEPVREEVEVGEAVQHAVDYSTQLTRTQQSQRRALLALSVSIGRWERQKRQYSELRRTMGEMVEKEHDRQRQWQTAAVQHIDDTNKEEGSSEFKSANHNNLLARPLTQSHSNIPAAHSLIAHVCPSLL